MSTEHTVVHLQVVPLGVQVQRHTVGQNEQFPGGRHFQVVGEDQSLAVRIDQSLVVGGERPVCVPATDRILVHLAVEQHLGVWVIKGGCGLRIGAFITEQLRGRMM